MAGPVYWASSLHPAPSLRPCLTPLHGIRWIACDGACPRALWTAREEGVETEPPLSLALDPTPPRNEWMAVVARTFDWLDLQRCPGEDYEAWSPVSIAGLMLRRLARSAPFQTPSESDVQDIPTRGETDDTAGGLSTNLKLH